MAALDRGLGGSGVRAEGGYGVSNLLPVVGSEVSAAEGVPFVAVGVDQGGRLLVGPARRREAPGLSLRRSD